MNEYIAESSNKDSFIDVQEKVQLAKDSLEGFVDFMNTFESVKEDWSEFFQLAKTELQQCKDHKANTMEEISDNLDRIQVNRKKHLVRTNRNNV